ncbi:MAG: acyl-ACP--UDP-N-acetylglucosamine O-acyltransferase [Bacteroidales bacterium]|nr:acyl-ACP--UDP-N-acetylglucosamine O-acyltransferase [Bacteroidales bacterium]MBQ9172721.1 acyl-ACP--UDP-N-acetylglucosamine O-acyltransferase [Bacteroidales bacterium]MBQ9711754.1 acyl-ACP--UDP-N-acetylglucosamine O-acyltransferase [Bacteroidales bacterium]
MNNIHPLAIVSPKAVLGDNVEVGPYAFIDDEVVIGDNCKIHPHAVIYKYVTMGSDCEVFPGAVVGAVPQDLKFDGEITHVVIGNHVTIRECATINRGTKASGKGVTRVGDNTLVMSYVHIAHDCNIGKNCILVSYVGVAGETDIDDWAILGGGVKAHQFSKIGCHAMVGGTCKVNKDVPPYALCGREPLSFAGVNIVGLRRRGFSSDVIRNIKDIYDTIYYQGLNISDGCAKVEAGFPDSEEKETILNFIRASKRGIVRALERGEKISLE